MVVCLFIHRMASLDLISEPTENLMDYIQWRDDPGYMEIAKQAFHVFTFRFQLDLLKKLVPVCKGWGYDEQVATEIAYGTFARIWKYPKFNKTKARQTDYDKAITFYLYGIAENLLADYKKHNGGEANPFTGEEEIIREFPNIENMQMGKERKAILIERQEYIKKLLDRLSPKHRIIYLTYKHYEHIIHDGYKLPRKLLQNLRTELDLTQNSIRVYKKEAFDEVDIYLNTYGSK
jgi:DNA-directed RNA polymerase specialized sigma24 family protein